MNFQGPNLNTTAYIFHLNKVFRSLTQDNLIDAVKNNISVLVLLLNQISSFSCEVEKLRKEAADLKYYNQLLASRAFLAVIERRGIDIKNSRQIVNEKIRKRIQFIPSLQNFCNNLPDSIDIDECLDYVSHENVPSSNSSFGNVSCSSTEAFVAQQRNRGVISSNVNHKKLNPNINFNRTSQKTSNSNNHVPNPSIHPGHAIHHYPISNSNYQPKRSSHITSIDRDSNDPSFFKQSYYSNYQYPTTHPQHNIRQDMLPGTTNSSIALDSSNVPTIYGNISHNIRQDFLPRTTNSSITLNSTNVPTIHGNFPLDAHHTRKSNSQNHANGISTNCYSNNTGNMQYCENGSAVLGANTVQNRNKNVTLSENVSSYHQTSANENNYSRIHNPTNVSSHSQKSSYSSASINRSCLGVLNTSNVGAVIGANNVQKSNRNVTLSENISSYHQTSANENNYPRIRNPTNVSSHSQKSSYSSASINRSCPGVFSTSNVEAVIGANNVQKSNRNVTSSENMSSYHQTSANENNYPRILNPTNVSSHLQIPSYNSTSIKSSYPGVLNTNNVKRNAQVPMPEMNTNNSSNVIHSKTSVSHSMAYPGLNMSENFVDQPNNSTPASNNKSTSHFVNSTYTDASVYTPTETVASCSSNKMSNMHHQQPANESNYPRIPTATNISNNAKISSCVSKSINDMQYQQPGIHNSNPKVLSASSVKSNALIPTTEIVTNISSNVIPSKTSVNDPLDISKLKTLPPSTTMKNIPQFLSATDTAVSINHEFSMNGNMAKSLDSNEKSQLKLSYRHSNVKETPNIHHSNDIFEMEKRLLSENAVPGGNMQMGSSKISGSTSDVNNLNSRAVSSAHSRSSNDNPTSIEQTRPLHNEIDSSKISEKLPHDFISSQLKFYGSANDMPNLSCDENLQQLQHITTTWFNNPKDQSNKGNICHPLPENKIGRKISSGDDFIVDIFKNLEKSGQIPLLALPKNQSKKRKHRMNTCVDDISNLESETFVNEDEGLFKDNSVDENTTPVSKKLRSSSPVTNFFSETQMKELKADIITSIKRNKIDDKKVEVKCVGQSKVSLNENESSGAVTSKSLDGKISVVSGGNNDEDFIDKGKSKNQNVSMKYDERMVLSFVDGGKTDCRIIGENEQRSNDEISEESNSFGANDNFLFKITPYINLKSETSSKVDFLDINSNYKSKSCGSDDSNKSECIENFLIPSIDKESIKNEITEDEQLQLVPSEEFNEPSDISCYDSPKLKDTIESLISTKDIENPKNLSHTSTNQESILDETVMDLEIHSDSDSVSTEILESFCDNCQAVVFFPTDVDICLNEPVKSFNNTELIFIEMKNVKEEIYENNYFRKLDYYHNFVRVCIETKSITKNSEDQDGLLKKQKNSNSSMNLIFYLDGKNYPCSCQLIKVARLYDIWQYFHLNPDSSKLQTSQDPSLFDEIKDNLSFLGIDMLKHNSPVFLRKHSKATPQVLEKCVIQMLR